MVVWAAGLGLLAVANAVLLAGLWRYLLSTGGGSDWNVFVAAAGGHPFDVAGWRWSPVAAWLFVPLAQIGLVAWQALHVAALALLPGWRLRALVLVSWPFWYDLAAGNLVTFVAVAAYWMLRRSTAGTLATLVLALLIPRPFMLVLAAWALWDQPRWRVPFLGLLTANLALLGLSGEGPAWAARLMESAAELPGHPSNIGPTRLFGMAWLIVAAPLSALAWLRGWIGVAALLVMPYLFPYYLLLAPLRALRHDEPIGDDGGGVQGTRSTGLRRVDLNRLAR